MESRWCNLPGHPAAVHKKNLPGDVGGGIRGQEDDRPAEVCGLSGAAEGDPALDPGPPLRIVEEGLGHLGEVERRGERLVAVTNA